MFVFFSFLSQRPYDCCYTDTYYVHFGNVFFNVNLEIRALKKILHSLPLVIEFTVLV